MKVSLLSSFCCTVDSDANKITISKHCVVASASYLNLCASVTKQYNLVPAKEGGKVTAGLVESNGSIPLTNVTCGLTAKKPGSAASPAPIIKYVTTLLFIPELKPMTDE